MYALTAARAREIGTLRAIGFARLPIFAAVLAESLALALAGGLIGVACAWLLFDGLTSSTLSSSLSQLVFESRLSAGIAAQAIALALSIGLLGGAAPAWKAARAPLRGLGSD
jgi:putative ABC transport system permease protein